MNITIVSVLEECVDRDNDLLHSGETIIQYPQSVEEAAEIFARLDSFRRKQTHRCDGWQSTVLFDGRELEDLDDNDEAKRIREQIDERREVLNQIAKQEEEKEELARRYANQQKREALEKESQRKQLEADQAKYRELKAKYGW